MRNWHYAVNGEKKGPVSEDEIIKLIDSGELNSETLVWTEEFTEWKKLSDVKDVFSVPVMVKAPEKQLSPALALASMILGILSIVCFGPLLAVPGLILGIIAMVMIKKGTASGKGFAIAGIVTSLISIILTLICIFLFSILSLSLPLILNNLRMNVWKINCASNLKAIGLPLKQYALDYDGHFPPHDGAAGLEILRKNSYLDDYKIYTCPSSNIKQALPGQPLREENVSYHYKGGYTEKDSSDLAILWDKDDNHRKFGNILFLDGHVQGYRGSDWKKNIISK